MDIDDFFKKLEEAYGNPKSKCAALLKICLLVQGKLSVSVYAAEFRPVAAELDWNEAALVHQFMVGFRQDIQYLMLSLPDLATLVDAINAAIK